MAVRVTHTNNSDGHDGTFVYRSTSPMDPQALPAPIADEPPVALGAVFEYIDNVSEDGTYYYRTQDHEGGQASTVSDQVSVLVGDDFSTAQHGDYIGGGVYAGTLNYDDGRQFYIVFALQSGELGTGSASRWKTSRTATSGATDPDDGEANTAAMESAGLADHPAASHCRNYTDGDGNADYYLPARNELALEANIRGHAEMSTDTTLFRWESTEESSDNAYRRRFSDGAEGFNSKDDTTQLARPIRRVPV